MGVPVNVVVQYNHRFLTVQPENKAGVIERDGFMEDPDINAKKEYTKK